MHIWGSKRGTFIIRQGGRIFLEKQNYMRPVLCKLKADGFPELPLGKELPWGVTQLSLNFT